MMRVTAMVISTIMLLITGVSDISAQKDISTPNILTLGSDGKSPPATIEEVSWISGHWEGAAFGGNAQEIWSPVQGNTMMGMYRLIRDENVVFYEFLTITQEHGSLLLKLKHFHPDLRGWEEKDESVTFPLVRVTGEGVFFDGMTFRKVNENEITVFVRQISSDGSASELEFSYRREAPDR